VDTPEEIESLSRAMLEVQKWLMDIWNNEEPRWLLLCGVSGNGKTHLAERAAAFLRRYGERCYNLQRKELDPMMGNPELIYSYQQERGIFTKWDNGLLKPAKGGEFYPLTRAEKDWYKIIDEIGSEQKERGPDGVEIPTAFAKGTLSSLMDGRIRKWTLATSNLLRRDFAVVYDVRVADRFARFPNVIHEIQARSFALRMEEACKRKTQR
jgi:hypothetical protein